MDDLVVRSAVVLLLLVAAVVGGAWRNRRPGPRPVHLPGLGPGVVVFTSATCPACHEALQRLDETLGEGGYRQLRLDEDRATFERHRIGRLPSVALLDAGGEGHLWEGLPPARTLRRHPGA